MDLNLWPPGQAQETHGFRLSHLSPIYLSVQWGGCDPVWRSPDGMDSKPLVLHVVTMMVVVVAVTRDGRR